MFGLEPWVLSKAMYKMVEGACARFLQQITEKWARWIKGGTWATLTVEEVRESLGTQFAATYIGRRQETVDKWVVLHPIFEVCAR